MGDCTKPSERYRQRNPVQSLEGSEFAMKVQVHVRLKPGVLDPQGRAIHHSLEGLGFSGVEDVRAGRLIELEVADSVSDEQLDDMCRKLLANMVIEDYRVHRVAEKETA